MKGFTVLDAVQLKSFIGNASKEYILQFMKKLDENVLQGMLLRLVIPLIPDKKLKRSYEKKQAYVKNIRLLNVKCIDDIF